MAITKDDVKEYIKNASVLEIAELVKELEEEFGVSAQAPVAVAAVAPGAAAEGGASEAEKTEFDVVLSEIGDQKIAVIKEVKNITGKDLKEAKAIVDKVPSVIAEKVPKEKAEEIKQKLEAAGAVVEIK